MPRKDLRKLARRLRREDVWLLAEKVESQRARWHRGLDELQGLENDAYAWGPWHHPIVVPDECAVKALGYS